jgi:PAS domain S-box-containing protein
MNGIEDSDAGLLARRNALLDRAEQLAGMGSWEWDLDTDELFWSDNRFRLSGLEPGQIIPTIDYSLERVHPGDAPRLERRLELARETGSMPPVEYRLLLCDGTTRHFRARSATIGQGAGQSRLIAGIVEDLTERRHAEREIAAHSAVSETLDRWETLERSGLDLLRNLGQALGSEVAGLWLPEEGLLTNRLLWTRATDEIEDFAAVTRRLRFPPGVGLVGRVWESQEPIHLGDVLDQPDDVPRRMAAARAGLHGAVALTARCADEVLAVLDFYFHERDSVTEPLLQTLTSIGYDLGRFLSRRRGDLAPPPLTPRELEVLQLAAEGLRTRVIAERLGLSFATVKTHLEHIYDKLGCKTRVSAVASGLRQGLIK